MTDSNGQGGNMETPHVQSDPDYIVETMYVDAATTSVSCCGEGVRDGGHPKVYLFIGDKDYVICPYCHRHFVRKQRKQDG